MNFSVSTFVLISGSLFTLWNFLQWYILVQKIHYIWCIIIKEIVAGIAPSNVGIWDQSTKKNSYIHFFGANKVKI